MNNTAKSFSDKWSKNTTLALDVTLDESSDIFNWILNRNGFADASELASYLSDKKRVLDAGCGNGRVTTLLRKYAPAETQVVGIDLVASQIAAENLSRFQNVFFFEKNLLGDLSDLGSFDFIYCQEVLHHTDHPEKGFHNLVSLLEPEGEIAIYVYKKKAPAREFIDDFIREQISNLTYDEAMAHCRQITALGKALHHADVKVTVPAVDLLQIPAGEYDLQRFIYHFFAKCFWNDQFSFEENAVINYDWYHPQNCARYSIEEVREWFTKSNLDITYEHVDFYGITIRGKKKDV